MGKRSIRFVDLAWTDRDRRVWGGDFVWPTQSGSLCCGMCALPSGG